MAKLPKGYRFYVRKFLNGQGHFSSAHIIATATSWRGTASDLTLHIADCDRKVKFTLPVYYKADRKNTLDKLDAMIDTLCAFRDVVQDICVEASRGDREEVAQ